LSRGDDLALEEDMPAFVDCEISEWFDEGGLVVFGGRGGGLGGVLLGRAGLALHEALGLAAGFAGAVYGDAFVAPAVRRERLNDQKGVLVVFFDDFVTDVWHDLCSVLKSKKTCLC